MKRDRFIYRVLATFVVEVPSNINNYEEAEKYINNYCNENIKKMKNFRNITTDIIESWTEDVDK